MEADEEERELGDLCAEILENWNTPIHTEMVHQNPFSTAYDYDYDYDSDVEQVEEQLKLSSSSTHSIVSQRPILSCTRVETKISSSKRKYEGDRVKDKGLKGEKSNSSIDGSIIPVLVADTFYDKLLGHGSDGIDIAALVKVKEAETCDADADAGQPSSLFKCNSPMVNSIRMPKRSPISAAKHGEFRVCTQRDFVRKLGVMLSSNKKISIDDDFGEKMWRNPGVDTTDFFNYGLDEKQWKDYCKEMHALIHEGSSGRNKTNADTSSNSIEEGEICEEEPNRGMDECSSFCSSDVIIGIAEGDSFYQKKPYQTSFKYHKQTIHQL